MVFIMVRLSLGFNDEDSRTMDRLDVLIRSRSKSIIIWSETTLEASHFELSNVDRLLFRLFSVKIIQTDQISTCYFFKWDSAALLLSENDKIFIISLILFDVYKYRRIIIVNQSKIIIYVALIQNELCNSSTLECNWSTCGVSHSDVIEKKTYNGLHRKHTWKVLKTVSLVLLYHIIIFCVYFFKRDDPRNVIKVPQKSKIRRSRDPRHIFQL